MPEYMSAKTLQQFVDSLPFELRKRQPRDVGMPPYYGDKINLCVGKVYAQINYRGITIDGSLCKAIFGNNFETLPHDAIVYALNEIADMFCVPLDQWVVTRLDVGTNLLMDKQPISYLHHFGELSRYDQKPTPQKSTLYYTQTTRKVSIYDKIAEAIDKKQVIPQCYADKNVLRLETSALKGQRSVMNAYKLPEPLTAAQLCDCEFYANTIVSTYINVIQSIKIIQDMEININQLTTLKTVDQMGRAAIIEKAGGITNLLQTIDRRRANGEITKKQASDLRRTFRKVAETSNLLLPSDEVAELNSKIEALPDAVRALK